MPDPLIYYGLALELLDCVAASLDETEMLAPARRCVVPGIAINEECCEREPAGGQLTVSLIRNFQSRTFPEEFTGVLLCGQGTTVLELEVKILRCGAVLDAQGTSPTCEEQAADAQLTAIDAYAVLQGTTCCFDPENFTVIGQNWIDLDPGCIGTTTRVLIDAGQVCCVGS